MGVYFGAHSSFYLSKCSKLLSTAAFRDLSSSTDFAEASETKTLHVFVFVICQGRQQGVLLV